MVESRCGLLCSECSYKEETGCQGCMNIRQPFWGESCPVKSCCESRESEHCGRCSAFPCEIINQFSYDENQGDNGKRIRQCEKWNGKQV